MCTCLAFTYFHACDTMLLILASWSFYNVVIKPCDCSYLAPEFLMHGIVDEKTDVFAFGVVLLELITGRRALDYSQQSLVIWVFLVSPPLLYELNL